MKKTLLLLLLTTISLFSAELLQDWIDQTFSQGKYEKNNEPILKKDIKTLKSKDTPMENKIDYTKATSLQDAIDMLFSQGKYKK